MGKIIVQEKDKIQWLLILQGWAMLWVVIGHAGPSATLEDYPSYAFCIHEFAYSFHMQLFITISGFLFYLTRLNNDKWTYRKTICEKLVRFGIPFFVFTIIGMILKSVFAGSIDRATTISVWELVHAIMYPYNGPMREFWFLATIMWYFALFPLWKLVLRSRWISVLTMAVLAALSIKHPESDLFAIRHMCFHAFFFFLGIMCAVLYTQKQDYILQRGFVIISFVIGVLIYIVGMVWHIPLVVPLGGICFSLSISCFLYALSSRVFCGFRNYTYQIFIMGIFFQVFILIIRNRFGLPFLPMYILSFFLGLYMPVLISLALEWINWKPLLMCVGLKGKSE